VKFSRGGESAIASILAGHGPAPHLPIKGCHALRMTACIRVHNFVKPGPQTSCYTSALYFVNGVALVNALLGHYPALE
jgi:hypothetical protein